MKNIKKKINFQENEKVVKIIKHYFLVIVPGLAISILIIVLDFFLMVYFLSYGVFGAVFFFAILGVAIIYFVRLLFLWNRNFIIITNKRIIDYEKSSFLKEKVSDFSYKEIKNVSSEIKGLFKTIFRYGDLHLEIIEQPLGFVLYNLRKPVKMLEIINNQLISYQEKLEAKDNVSLGRLLHQISLLVPDERKKLARIVYEKYLDF